MHLTAAILAVVSVAALTQPLLVDLFVRRLRLPLGSSLLLVSQMVLELLLLTLAAGLGILLFWRALAVPESPRENPGPGRALTARVSGPLAGASLVLAALTYWAGAPSPVQALLLALAVTLGVVALVRRAPAEDRRWLTGVALLALGVRLAAAIALHVYGIARSTGLGVRARGLVLDDESIYQLSARAALLWGGNLSVAPPPTNEFVQGPLVSFLTGLYAVLGPDPLLARLLTAGVGTGAVLLVAWTARGLFGSRAGLIAGATLALAPGQVLWSTTILKESLILGFVALTLWLGLQWSHQRGWVTAAAILGTVTSATMLREFAGIALAIPICLGLLTALLRRSRMSLRGIVRVIALTGLAAVVGGIGAVFTLPDLAPGRLVYRQTVMQLVPPPHQLLATLGPGYTVVGRGVGGPIVAVADGGKPAQVPGMVIGFSGGTTWTDPVATVVVATSRESVLLVPPDQILPITRMTRDVSIRHVLLRWLQGMADVLLGPMNGGLAAPAWAVLALDQVLWLMLAGAGVVALRKHRRGYLLVPLGFLAGVLFVLTMVPGNLGNLVRQRSAMTLGPLALLASPALADLARRLDRARDGRRVRRPVVVAGEQSLAPTAGSASPRDSVVARR